MNPARGRHAILLTCGAAFALAGSLFAAQTSDPQALGYPKTGQPGIVKVLAAGAEPRAALRYSVPAGYKSHLDMAMEMSMAMSMSGQTMPPTAVPTMKIGADVAVTAVS